MLAAAMFNRSGVAARIGAGHIYRRSIDAVADVVATWGGGLAPAED